MQLSTLLRELDYEQSPHYRSDVNEFEPETAHLYRAAHDAGVSGIYVFQASPALSQKVIVDRPAVYVAEAKDLYTGPRNLDTERGRNKIYSRHDEKTVYSRFQSASGSGNAQRREDTGANRRRV